MSKVLLINPSYQPSYGGAKAAITNPIHPTLGLATIAAGAQARGHSVEIYDMSFRPYDHQSIRERILEAKPDVVGITATTPLMNQLRDMSVLIKDISKDIRIVGGGAHPSAMPEATLRESMLDAVFTGEADLSFGEYCDATDPRDVSGLYVRHGDEIVSTGFRTPIENLDDLPLPAWELFEIEDYHRMSRLLSKRRPVTIAEFSRGCVFKCDFCASKITMALGYRKKSPERCADEVEKMKSLGFREFMLADDIFTSDEQWAHDVADTIAKRDLDMLWSCSNGIRVESANDRLFKAMRRAGCYRVSFGFESGNDQILKSFGKGGKASIEQGRAAVKMARNADIETTGFFMLGLSPDNKETMYETIEFARKIPVDMMKFGIAIAFPGTKMFNDYERDKLIKSYNWDDYFIYTDEPLFAHKYLGYDDIKEAMDFAYKRAILLNPGFILRRFWRGIKSLQFFWDAYYAVRFFTAPAISGKIDTPYYARDRWPTMDFDTHQIEPANYQIVRKKKKDADTPLVSAE